MYYYRWWTLRKHIKETPVGYGMTEFLVNRSYADKYNLIACAIGHHIYESRWLRNPEYLNQIIPVSYTHLDVYKRQFQSSEMVSILISCSVEAS